MRRIAGLVLLLGALAAFVGVVRASRIPSDDEVHVFEALSGPREPSVIAPLEHTSWRAHEAGTQSRLAILLSDPQSPWLGLVHGLRSLGVPFVVTDDYERALRHRVVLVYPRITGRVLAPPALRALADFVRRGGTLAAVNVLGGGLQALFGFADVAPRRDHTRVHLDLANPLAAAFDDPREAELRIASAEHDATRIGAHDYLEPRERPLAVYEDGQAAIVAREFASGGRAYAFGFDPGLLLLKAHNRRLEGLSDAYANAYEPSADVALRLLAAIYRRGEPLAVTLEPVPDARPLALIVTHDVDYSRSMANAATYARQESEAGFAATYFVQTKYVRDWNDEIFLDDVGARRLVRLAELGMEIASHSVAHAEPFDAFPIGSGQERYPEYRPFVKNRTRAYAGTILGELRVSRFLLEALTGTRVVAFRPGHLSNPRSLPQALAATGYRFSSSVTANVSLSHLPFRLNRGRDVQMESSVFEFPVTIEDELGPPPLGRLDEAIDVGRRIARHGGLYVLLIHPDTLGEKLEFERRLVEALRPLAWLGPLGEYGRWWAARDAVELDVRETRTGARVEIVAPIALEGLALRLPIGFEPVDTSLVRARCDRIVLGAIEGRTSLELRSTNDAPCARP
jgi:peptidoglycan/xylan/chitin deacetylase (PgdA/CDA1 family)